MQETLLVRMDADDPGRAAWCVVDARGELAGPVGRGTLPSAAALAPGRAVVVAVPGRQVLQTRTPAPALKGQKLLSAVSFGLEEVLADDIERLHFAIGTRGTDGQLPVAVVARGELMRWLEALEQAGLRARRVIRDSSLLPLYEGEWTLLLEPGTAQLRTGPDRAFGFDRSMLPDMLARLACEPDALPGRPRVRVSLAAGEELPALLDEMCDVVDAGTCADAGMDLLARGLAGPARPINLLQGEFSSNERWGRYWRPWRATAALLLAGLALAWTHQWSAVRALEQERTALNGAIEQVYRQTFPEARNVVRPRAQMEQKLAELARGGIDGAPDFLALLGSSGRVLAATGDVDILGVSYRDGRLDLDIVIASLQALDQLKQRLNESGDVQVEIQSATADADERVKSRLRVKGVTS